MVSQMINVIISGIYGKMGTLIRERISKEKDISCIGGVDIIKSEGKSNEIGDISIVSNIEDIIERTDLVVDFSIASATIEKLPVCIRYNKGMVIGTTGFSDKEIDVLRNAGEKIPILYSSNMSIAVHLLYKLVSEASKVLKKDMTLK